MKKEDTRPTHMETPTGPIEWLKKWYNMARFRIPILIIWDVSSILYMILNVEFSLQMNNIVGVYDMWSVGQLIPIIIGAGGLAVAAAELYVFLRQRTLKVDWEAEKKLGSRKATELSSHSGLTEPGDRVERTESTLPEVKD